MRAVRQYKIQKTLTRERRDDMEGLKQLILFLRLLRKNQKGVTTVEYAVMLVLVAIAVMIAAPNISTAVVDVFTNVSSRLTAGV
ncbi:MAG: hypothetical protein DMG13_24410 [Acidobacteria bacterium]|nr:MAG: hypothetical protein DMG13_24410 [Acidobacteriota bacterium]